VQMLENLAIQAMIRFQGQNRDEEHGQTLVEYGLIVAFVAIVSVVIVQTIGSKVPAFFTTAASKLHS